MIFSIEPVKRADGTFAPGRCRAIGPLATFEPRGFDEADRALDDLARAGRSRRREPVWLGWLLLGGLALWVWILLRAVDIAFLRAVGR